MSEKLQLISIDSGGFLKVAATENLHGGIEFSDGKNPLKQLLGNEWASQRVLLDLTKTEHVDSNAIGWLINSDKAFKTNKGALVVHSAPPRVRQLFKMLNITSVITLADDEESGRALLTGAAR